MVTKYYIMPKVGTGRRSGREQFGQSEVYAIRPKYVDEAEALAPTKWTRKFDDPLVRNTSLNGSIGLYAFINIDPAVLSLLATKTDIIDLGNSPQAAREAIKSRLSFDQKMQVLRLIYPTDRELDALLNIRTSRIQRRPGTDTTTWNDADTTGWGALTANALTQVHISGTDNMDAWDVLTNRGRSHDAGGGAFFSTSDLWHQTTDNAEDQTVQVEWFSGVSSNQEAMVAARVVVGDTDTFFHGRNISIAGNDTRLVEIVDGVANELDSDTQTAISTPKQMRLVVKTNGVNTDIDFDIWASSGSPPATPQIEYAAGVNPKLQDKSGHGGVYMFVSRTTTTTVENLIFTNNDVAGATSLVPPRRQNTLLRM